jgi:large subunit ribosomal protein L17
MRHLKGNKKLGKPTDQRLALLKSLVLSLFTHSKIKTTDTRAKEAQKMAEKLITLGKRGDLAARRQAIKILPNKGAIKELFENIAPRFADRNGGYTKTTKLGFRRGDASPVSLVELVD